MSNNEKILVFIKLSEGKGFYIYKIYMHIKLEGFRWNEIPHQPDVLP